MFRLKLFLCDMGLLWLTSIEILGTGSACPSGISAKLEENYYELLILVSNCRCRGVAKWCWSLVCAQDVRVKAKTTMFFVTDPGARLDP